MKKIYHEILSIRFVLIIAVLLFMYVELYSASLPLFRHIQASDGLADNQTEGVFFLPDGRLGIRTPALLSIYDGYRYLNFPYDDRNIYEWSSPEIPISHYVDCKRGVVWMKGRNVLRVFDCRKERFISDTDSLLRMYGVRFPLSNMFVDAVGRHWFVSADGRIAGWNDGNAFDSEFIISSPGQKAPIIHLDGDKDEVYVVFADGRIVNYELNGKRLKREYTDFVGLINTNDRVLTRIGDDGKVWMIWDKGGAVLDRSKKWRSLDLMLNGERDAFTALDMDSSGNIYIGTGQSGYYFIDGATGKISHYTSITLADGNELSSDITGIAVSKYGEDIWFGLMFQGVAYHNPCLNQFEKVRVTREGDVLSDNSVNAMVNDGEGLLWLATTDGLFTYSPISRKLKKHDSVLGDKLCLTIYKDSKGDIWVGTFSDGLYRVSGGRCVSHFYSSQKVFHVFQRDVNTNQVRKIFEDSHGRYWVAVKGGLCRFYPDSGRFESMSDAHPELTAYRMCNDIAEDEHGQIVVATASGIFSYNPEKDFVWRPEVDHTEDPRYLHRNALYTCILRDSRGLWWFGMQNGLNIVDMKTGDVFYLDSDNGLANSVIKALVEDDHGNVWVSTANGINRVKPTHCDGGYSFETLSFRKDDGLIRGEYATTSVLKSADGSIYFGGQKGFSRFHPSDINYNPSVGTPVITGLKLFNTPIRVGDRYNGKVILSESPGYIKELNLDYDENFITIEFSGLNFNKSNNLYYRYRLEGFDSEWNEIQGTSVEPQAVYTDLPPGSYTFRVYAANESKEWGEKCGELKVTVHPPFWDTAWAHIVYVIIVISILLGIAAYFIKRNRIKVARLMEEERTRREEELNQMKFRFFTNVSHEFRTPLTLILTPLESYINKMEDGEDKRKLSSIRRHALELLSLVNQLLDFRKLEMNGECLHLHYGDAAEFIGLAVGAFNDTAKEREIELTYAEALSGHNGMYFDRDKLHKIINNLLSNAFKFTPSGGKVSVCTSIVTVKRREYICIKVADSGIGIPEKDLPHVFERFYQSADPGKLSASGSGIGLHMIKEYVNLHEGMVSVESKSGKGTEFIVMIPMDLKPERSVLPVSANTDKDKLSEAIMEESGSSRNEQSAKPRLLVVEDNEEFRAFMKEELDDNYEVECAADGVQGENIAREHNPDIIVSDIMMPLKDGIELCRSIKTDIATSHIPVILLTARTSDETHLRGFSAGADAYISKPFNMDILKVRLRQLIENRAERQEKFIKEITVTPSSVTITSLDEQLVRKALECVERNMDNSEYSVDEMSSDLGMSRQTLYRKMQGILGQTPKDFIRSVRMKRAAQLLKDTDLPVSEISYMTGFSTPRHFAKIFKETFGTIPSLYAGKSILENEERNM